MSEADLGARVDQQHMQIADLATQVDTLNNLNVTGINICELRQETIDTFRRAQARISTLEAKMVDLDQEMDRVLQLVSAAKEKTKHENSLMDIKVIPETYDNPDKQKFRQWAEKVKLYCSGTRRGFREATQWAEEQTVVDDITLATITWDGGRESNHQFAEFLLQIIGEEANLIVEECGANGLEAWRRLNVRFDPPPTHTHTRAGGC